MSETDSLIPGINPRANVEWEAAQMMAALHSAGYLNDFALDAWRGTWRSPDWEHRFVNGAAAYAHMMANRSDRT